MVRKVVHDRTHQINRNSSAMRGPLMTFAMITSLIVIWHAVHWIARGVVAEFGIFGGILACGACFVVSQFMDP
jgi:hypothetical protein